MIEAGTFLQQRYRIDRQIGQGGMGAVYVAKDERFDSTVAIKETLCFADENFRKAIEREARLLNSLRHSALPRVSDHFEEQNGQFLVMEYIPGEDVAAMMESSGKPFPVDQVLKWADQLLDALDYLHNQEMPVIHRDIKPQNLKINSRGEMILLDFGLAKGNPTDAGHLTAAKSIFGYSRNYASLEQIQGTGTDPRSDLYSLAATLYHMLTGQPPEDALTRAMSVLSKKADPLVPASALNPEVPRGVAGVLHKALDLDAGERPADARALQEMLRNNEAYGYLVDEVTVVLGQRATTEAHVFAQPTKLMPVQTQAGTGSTGVAGEISGAGASGPARSELTSVRLTNTTDGGVPAGRFRKLAFAVPSLIIVAGVAAAGVIYIADPAIFASSAQRERPSVQAAAEPPARSDADASVSSLDVNQAVNTESVPPVSEAPARTHTERAGEPAVRTQKPPARDKTVPKDTTADIDIQVDDPDIPAGGVLLTDRDANGKIRTMRVTPKTPVVPKSEQFVIRGFNPFPPGFDFRNMTPAQRKKFQQMIQERSRRETHLKPPPTAPKPTP